MATIRVQDLAKKLGVTPKQVMTLLAAEGHPVKDANAAMEASLERVLRKRLEEKTAAPAGQIPDRSRGQARIASKSASGGPEPAKAAPPKPRAEKKTKEEARGPAAKKPARGVKATPAPPEIRPSLPTAPQVEAPRPEPKREIGGVRPTGKPVPERSPAPATPAVAATGGRSAKEAAPPKPKPSQPQAPRAKEEAARPEERAMEHEISPNKMRQLIEVMEEDVARTPYARMMEKALPKKKPVTGPFFRGRPGPRGRWPETKVGVKQPGVRPPVVEAPSKPRKKGIKIHEGMLVKDLAEVFGQKVPEVIKKLMELGIMASINQPVDPDAALLVAEAFGMKAEVVSVADREEMLEEVQDEASLLRPRPPVVTIMGHVDHGKTSLLDAIRQTKVTLSEAGGITQHIGAYKVRIHDRDIVFLDTPGHEAFTAMRARGAQVTDIVVLVVAADDGVMPQTKEAINHARAAEVPILVAINKIDKPEAKPERVKQELSEQGLLPEAWGGQTIFAEVSAKKRIGLEHLLEMILLQADVLELKANPEKAARGSVIEAKLDRGRGPVATVLVQNGTVRTGDAFVCGTHYGRVRALVNDEGKKVEEASPSIPVEVIGCSGVPQAGDAFIVVAEEREARQIALTRTTRLRASELAKAKRITLSELHARIQEGEVRELNVILKGDVQGSVEAMAEALTRLGTEAVKVKILHASVGGITETDVMLASASNAIVLGFNVRPETKAAALAEQEGVDIRTYTVIYDAIADVKAALEGLLAPTLRERVLGRAEVRVTFSISKVGTIAGCYVTDGMVTRAGSGIRVLRDNVVIYEGKIGSLKRFKEDVREVQAGYECGISVEHFNDIKAGDVLECYTIEKEAAKLA